MPTPVPTLSNPKGHRRKNKPKDDVDFWFEVKERTDISHRNPHAVHEMGLSRTHIIRHRSHSKYDILLVPV